MLKLPEVTIWTMVWADDHKWIIRAGQVLRYCKSVIECNRMLLFVHNKIAPRDYPWETIQIPQLNWQSYNIFVNRVIPTYIKSQFAMSVHEDGFPLDLTLWKPEFLDYDYIGAPWSDGVVGNGGFNIESRKLMEYKCRMPVLDDEFMTASDRVVCTTRRAYLESEGVKFAPRELAEQFSTEQTGGDRPSFGFHGRLVSAKKYHQGWRIINSMNLKPDPGFTLERNKVVKAPRRPASEVKHPTSPVYQSLQSIAFPPVEQMKITVVYVYPLVAGSQYHGYANRFIESYRNNPPGMDHETVIVFNGAKRNPTVEKPFEGFPNLRFVEHDNSGYDLGAFQMVSRQCTSDLIVFFGASTYLNGPGWLKRMAEASAKHGNALYGAMGNRGDSRYRVWPHIRTTAFWMSPALFNAYPKSVRRSVERHGFEHGPDCFTSWVVKQGLKALVVTKTGEYEWKDWDSDPNGFQRGNESSILAGDHISEPPYYQPK